MEIKIDEYEKLGALLPWARVSTSPPNKPASPWCSYDSKDLVTHGVVLGMTGSGKTGLCLSIIEEAAMDNIPAIIIDPKGDLSNLLLTFPELAARRLSPVDQRGRCAKKAQSPDEYAAAQAAVWKKGLGEWGHDQRPDPPTAREGRNDHLHSRVATPGLRSQSCRASKRRRSKSSMTTNCLASGSRAPFRACWRWSASTPIRFRAASISCSRTIISTRWRKGENLTLAAAHRRHPNPAVRAGRRGRSRIVLPRKEAHRTGDGSEQPARRARIPDVARRRAARHQIDAPHARGQAAHLRSSASRTSATAERMFFVSLLLNQMLGWMRTQSRHHQPARAALHGRDLRLPPADRESAVEKADADSAQAGRAPSASACSSPRKTRSTSTTRRSSNIGTWWLGRLQTERDKARVLDGLEGAAAAQQHGFDRGQMDRMLSGLGNRIFLMNNAHEDAPVLSSSALVHELSARPAHPQPDQVAHGSTAQAAPPGHRAKTLSRLRHRRCGPRRPHAAPYRGDRGGGSRPPTAAKPTLSKGIPELFLPANSANPNKLPVVCVPHLLRAAEILFSDAKKGLNGKKKVTLLDPLRPKQEHILIHRDGAARRTWNGSIQCGARSCDRRVPAAAAVRRCRPNRMRR